MFAKVKFEIIAGLYTEFLNFLLQYDVHLKNIQKTKLGFTAVCDAKDFKKIAKATRKFGCKIKIISKIGLYFKVKKYEHRKGLIVGVLLVLLLNILFNNIIWQIKVDTYDERIINDVLRILYENDIYAGQLYKKEDFDNATHQIFLQNNDIGNIALNFYKGVLVCDVDERDEKEDYLKNEKSDYILSFMDGTIEDLRVYSGFTNLKVGDNVAKGDILVFSSSVFLTPPDIPFIPEDFVFPVNYQRPRAYITALCNKEYKTSIILDKKEYILTGERDSETYIQFLNLKIKLDGAKNKEEMNISQQKISSFDVFGFSFPITINKTTYYTRELKTINYNEKDFENIAITQINSIINQDERLKEVLKSEYSIDIKDNTVDIICKIYGEYEITI